MSKEVEFTTLVDILCWRAEQQPNQQAYTFLRNGEEDAIHVTYSQLDQQARAIGSWLQEIGAAGERALLLYPSGLDFIAAFFGCLYAGVIAVPTYPPRFRPNRPDRRFQAIVADSQTTVMLTNTKILSDSKRWQVHVPSVTHWLASDDLLVDEAASLWVEPELHSDTLAFLQYTSGSTGTPKGVMVTHGNLVHNSAIIHSCFGHTTNSQGVIWLPLYHDMGLIGGVIQPLYGGFPVTLMSPTAFIQKPIRWLQAISRYKATTSGGPNFAYDLCIQKTTYHERATLDLSSWQVAFNGAEPVRAETMERFAATFESCGFRREAFYPCYGMAETTLLVTGGSKEALPVVSRVNRLALIENRVVKASNGTAIVGCGRSWLGQNVVIVDPDSQSLCPDAQVGEIWVKGDSIARGYWNHPEETDRIFNAHLVDTGEGPFLRTGDLGFLSDGELFVTGRLKDLIIIRGRNYYPQDIEHTAERSHPALQPNCGAAFSVDVNEQERLVIVFELRRSHRRVDVEEVAGAIRAAVSKNHELEVYAVVLLRPTRIPKTTSGKIQRTRCRTGFLSGTLSVIGRSIRMVELNGHESSNEESGGTKTDVTRVDLETGLRTKLAEFVGSDVDLQQPINSLGLGSLGAVSLQSYIESQFGVFLPLELFFEETSPNQLITQILTGSQPTEQIPALPVGPSGLQPVREPSKAAQSEGSADELIKWLRDYANERINSHLIDERRSIPPYIVLDFGNRGLLGMQVPEQYGGLALNYRDALRVLEQLAAIDLSLALFVGNNHILGTRPIVNYAQPALREILLPALARGRELAAFALTEPSAGSNPRAIGTIAVSDGKGGWRLRGQKSWIGSASWAGTINIFARAVGHGGKPLGLTGFAVQQGTKGLRMGPEALTMGMRGTVQNSIYLNDVPVGPENLLGRVGAGMEVAQDAMMPARLGVAAMSVGGMKRCAQLILRYAERRTISTGRLLDNPVTLTRLNDLSAAITAVETLVARMALSLDQGLVVPKEVYITSKTSGPEFLWSAADHLVQLLGGRGYIETNVAPKILRDARVLRIFEGPTEPLNMFLGECVSNRGEDLHRFLTGWGAPEIAQELLQVAAQIKHCWVSQTAPFSDRISAIRQAYALTGEVATFAILLAALQGAQKSGQIHHAIEWVQREYDQRVENALTQISTSSNFLGAASIRRLITGYAGTIGNLEQTLAGEEHDLDDFLRITRSEDSSSADSLRTKVSNTGTTPISPETHQFDHFPEYRSLQNLVQNLGGRNPYFTPHEGINNDKTLIHGQEMINYASYNYLGMSGHEAISQATKKAVTRYGTSASASRLASGEIPLHRELETELAALIGAEDCMVYVGGFTTNVTTIGHLLGSQDLIVHDSLIHSSALQGGVLSGANQLSFTHNDWQALDQILTKERHNYRRVLIIIEGVYSMDGDIPDLPQFIKVKQQHKALLMVDEAHSIGVLGKHGGGIGEHFDVNRSDVDVWMGTLSKSFASCGGYIAGSKALVEYLKYTAPGFVYSVGMSPPNTGAALAAVRLLKAEPQRVVRLHKRARLFLELAHAHKLDTGMSKDSAVIPIIIGKASPCMQLAQALEKRGISVLPMIPPAVQDNASRLRFFISSTHTEEQIRFTVDTIAKELVKIQQ